MTTTNPSNSQPEKPNLNFYDVFRIGIELEMEIHDETFEKLTETTNELDSQIIVLKRDGSLTSQRHNTQCLELISAGPIQSEEEEQEYFKVLKEGLPDMPSDEGKFFAYKNESAGTHIHFSLQNDFNNNSIEENKNYLMVFDTARFMRFFLRRYASTFKLKKFHDRFYNQYSDTSLTENSNVGKQATMTPTDIIRKTKSMNNMEGRKHEAHYRWLSTHSVMNNKGLEIRIFPYLQTHEGIKQVVAFTKATLLEYWQMKKTQIELQLLKNYLTIINKNVHKQALPELKRFYLETILNMSRIPIGKQHFPGDARLFIAKILGPNIEAENNSQPIL